jgi:hypothetical protein
MCYQMYQVCQDCGHKEIPEKVEESIYLCTGIRDEPGCPMKSGPKEDMIWVQHIPAKKEGSCLDCIAGVAPRWAHIDVTAQGSKKKPSAYT